MYVKLGAFNRLVKRCLVEEYGWDQLKAIRRITEDLDLMTKFRESGMTPHAVAFNIYKEEGNGE